MGMNVEVFPNNMERKANSIEKKKNIKNNIFYCQHIKEKVKRKMYGIFILE